MRCEEGLHLVALDNRVFPDWILGVSGFKCIIESFHFGHSQFYFTQFKLLLEASWMWADLGLVDPRCLKGVVLHCI